MLTFCCTCGIKNGSKHVSFDVSGRFYLGRSSRGRSEDDSLPPSAGERWYPLHILGLCIPPSLFFLNASSVAWICTEVIKTQLQIREMKEKLQNEKAAVFLFSCQRVHQSGLGVRYESCCELSGVSSMKRGEKAGVLLGGWVVRGWTFNPQQALWKPPRVSVPPLGSAWAWEWTHRSKR